MIIKFFELNKLNIDKTNFILFYGKNEGLKLETIKKIFKNKNEIINYDEKKFQITLIILLKAYYHSHFYNEKL